MKIISLLYEYDIFDYMSEIVYNVEKNGFFKGIIIDVSDISVEQSVKDACKHCSSFNKNYSCPPYSPGIDKTKNILSKYTHGVLLVLKIPLYRILMKLPFVAGVYKKLLVLRFLRKMHYKILELERQSRKDGYRAYGFIAGKCLISLKCNCGVTKCQSQNLRRFSMESVGMNIFDLAKRYGIKLNHVLDDYFYYIGLFLIKNTKNKDRTVNVFELGLDETLNSSSSFFTGEHDGMRINHLQKRMSERYGHGKLYLALNMNYDESGIGMNKFIEIMKSKGYEIITYGYLSSNARYSIGHLFGNKNTSKWVYALATTDMHQY